MNSCPECGSALNYGAKSCSCGWGKAKNNGMSQPEKDQWDRDHKAAMKIQDDIATEQAQIWLEKNGIVGRHVKGIERRKALQAYLKRLNSLPRPESTAWAYDIVSRIADGEIVCGEAEKMARSVVHEPL